MTNQSNDGNPEPQAGKGKLRLTILLALFGLAVLALAYDFLVARPGVERAYAKVNEASEAIAGTPLTRLKNTDVQELLGRQPSETYEDGSYTVERYGWAAGMPVGMKGADSRSPGFGLRTHDYYALYSKSGTELVFQTHFKFKLDDVRVESVTPTGISDSIGDMDEGMMMGGGPGEGGPEAGGGGIGAGGGGPGGGGGGFDPAAIFARRDENQDGKLTGEELSGRIADRVEQLDTDKNGEVSREEFDAGMQDIFAGGGGGPGGRGPGGGGGRGDRPERPQRPDSDE